MVLKTWDELASLAMKSFRQGQDCLLDIDHSTARRNFTEAAGLFLTASKAAPKDRQPELTFNAAKSAYYAGNYEQTLELSGRILADKLDDDQKYTLMQLRVSAADRADKGFWTRLYRDYRQLMTKKDYDAILDLLRTDPFLLDESDHRQVIVHIFEKKGMDELAAHMRQRFYGPPEAKVEEKPQVKVIDSIEELHALFGRPYPQSQASYF